jgi:hypothetical protein
MAAKLQPTALAEFNVCCRQVDMIPSACRSTSDGVLAQRFKINLLDVFSPDCNAVDSEA